MNGFVERNSIHLVCFSAQARDLAIRRNEFRSTRRLRPPGSSSTREQRTASMFNEPMNLPGNPLSLNPGHPCFGCSAFRKAVPWADRAKDLAAQPTGSEPPAGASLRTWIIGAGAVAGDALDFERQVAPILAMRAAWNATTMRQRPAASSSPGPRPPSGAETGARRSWPGSRTRACCSRRWLQGKCRRSGKGHSQKLAESEVAVLRAWIASGSPLAGRAEIDRDERTSAVRAGRDWWSLQPVKRPTVPATRDRTGPRTRSTRSSSHGSKPREWHRRRRPIVAP